jgi:hypothetical protein
MGKGRVAGTCQRDDHVTDHMNTAGLVLSSCQHVPLEIQHKGTLLCSILVKENQKRWEDLSQVLRNTGRGFPASPWAQMGCICLHRIRINYDPRSPDKELTVTEPYVKKLGV